MKFNYQARTKEGKIQTGVVEASSKEAAVILLQRHNLFVTVLEEVELMPVWMRKVKFAKTARKDVMTFSRQLAVMVKSNIPLLEALQTIAEGFSKNPDFREKILKLAEEIEGGASLSQALSIYPKIFSSFYTSMIKSGETSGNLSEDLEYLAEHQEREYTFRSKIGGAMAYPIFVLIMVILVLLGVTTFVIPKMTEVLFTTGQELPFVTRAIIAVSNFIKKWILLLAVGGGSAVYGFLKYLKTEEGKRIFDKIWLKIPIVGELLKKIYISRIAENLSTLIAGGLPIAQALQITGEIIENTVYKDIIAEAKSEVRRGETISTVFRRYPEAVSPFFTQMAMIGEKTGQLDSILLNVVDFYQKEVDRGLESVLSLLEPLMIVFLGGIVAFLMLGVLMPIYQTITETF